MDHDDLPTSDVRPNFNGPRIDDVFYLENTEPAGYGLDPTDRMPKPMPMHTMEDTESPLLHPDRFVCMETESRRKCKHYRRQLFPWPEDKERNACTRYCTALKNENGELFNIGDSEILACEFRDPPDPRSDALLKAHDEKVLEMQSISEKEEEVFDPLKALKEENND